MSEIKEKVEAELKTVKSMCETMENAIKTQIDKGLDKVNTHELYEAMDIFKDLSEVKKNIVETCYKLQIMEAMEEYGEDDEEGEEVRYYRGQPRSKTTGRYMRRNDGRRNYQMYLPDMEWDRDMDRYTGNRMYYSSGNAGNTGNSNGTSQSGNMTGGNTGNSSRSYTEGYSDGNRDGSEQGRRKGYEDGERDGYRRGYDEAQRNRSAHSRYDNARRGYEESKAMHTANTAEDNNANVRKIEEMMDVISEDVKELLLKMTPSEKTAVKARLQTMTQHIV